MGHVHLYAATLNESMRFYHNVLGFQAGLLIASFRMGDVGLSEDQPHVIAFNTWQGEGAPPSPPDSLGLRYFTIVLPDKRELERTAERIRKEGIAAEPMQDGILVSDPSQIGVMLTAGNLNLR